MWKNARLYKMGVKAANEGNIYEHFYNKKIPGHF